MTQMAHIPHVNEMIKVKWIQILAELFKKKWRIIATPCVGICSLRYIVHQTRPVELPTMPEQHTYPNPVVESRLNIWLLSRLGPSSLAVLSSKIPPKYQGSPSSRAYSNSKMDKQKVSNSFFGAESCTEACLPFIYYSYLGVATVSALLWTRAARTTGCSKVVAVVAVETLQVILAIYSKEMVGKEQRYENNILCYTVIVYSEENTMYAREQHVAQRIEFVEHLPSYYWGSSPGTFV